MKKIPLLFVNLFLVQLCVTAQEKSKNEIYNLEKLTTITTLSPRQVTQLKTASNERESSLAAAADQEQELAINRAYYQRLSQVLDEDQLDEVFNFQVDKGYVAEKTRDKYSKLITSYPFPDDHKETLKSEIYQYEYAKVFFKKKLFLDEEARFKKWDELTIAFNLWRTNQKNAIRSAAKVWDEKLSGNEKLTGAVKRDFIAYQFYAGLSEPATGHKEKLRSLASSPSLIAAAQALARQEADRITQSSGEMAKLDKSSRDYGRDQLANRLYQGLFEKMAAYKPLKIEKNTAPNKQIAVAAGKEHQIKQKEIDLKDDIQRKCEKAGLDEETSNKVLSLVLKRERDLRELNARRKNGSEELFENASVKSKKQVKIEFSKNLSAVISRSEFAAIFKDTFKEVILAKTSQQLAKITTSHELGEEQLAKIESIVQRYFFGRETTEAYYAFDSALKKQKISGLRYHFEKDYKALMQEFGIEVAPASGANSRTFEW